MLSPTLGEGMMGWAIKLCGAASALLGLATAVLIFLGGCQPITGAPRSVAYEKKVGGDQSFNWNVTGTDESIAKLRIAVNDKGMTFAGTGMEERDQLAYYQAQVAMKQWDVMDNMLKLVASKLGVALNAATAVVLPAPVDGLEPLAVEVPTVKRAAPRPDKAAGEPIQTPAAASRPADGLP